jgi:hypothetical protein
MLSAVVKVHVSLSFYRVYSFLQTEWHANNNLPSKILNKSMQYEQKYGPKRVEPHARRPQKSRTSREDCNPPETHFNGPIGVLFRWVKKGDASFKSKRGHNFPERKCSSYRNGGCLGGCKERGSACYAVSERGTRIREVGCMWDE